MSERTNLNQLFHLPEVNEVELAQILNEHFHGCMQPNISEVLYPGDRSEYAIKLVYGKHHLIDIFSGPALTDNDVQIIAQKIRDQLLNPGPSRIGRIVLFSDLPLEGYFRYRNVFQILPLPAEAPRPNFLWGEHPFLLEFNFLDSESFAIGSLRSLMCAREIELLMNALTQAGVRGPAPTVQHHWVTVGTGDPIHSQSIYAREDYHYDGMNLWTESFSCLEGLSPAECMHREEYYTRYAVGFDEGLSIPTDFSESIDRFFRLRKEDKDRLIRSSYWLQHARRVFTYSQSAAFTALVSAVEALIPEENIEAMCPECGHKSGKRSVKPFVKFVDKYISKNFQVRNRKNLFRVRSKLSHGGHLLYRDRIPLHPGLHPEETRESEQTDEISRLVRTLLVNWLWSPDRNLLEN